MHAKLTLLSVARRLLNRSSFSSHVVREPLLFDRHLKRQHRQFALNLQLNSSYYNYLRDESNRQLLDRINDIKKEFPLALEVGCFNGDLFRLLNSSPSLKGPRGGIGGIEKLIQCDAISHISNNCVENQQNFVEREFLHCNEESLPFKSNQFDIVLSSLSLHWVNDLNKVFSDLLKILKPDGVLIASLLGNETLKELRNCFYFAEQERKGGMSYHTSPFVRTSDIAALMQSTNFSLPTVDIDTITISYPSAFVLMEHLFKMGESNANINRSIAVGRDTFISAASLYQELYGLEDGTVPATFEIIYLIGWKPHDSQPKPCQRGSAQHSLKAV